MGFNLIVALVMFLPLAFPGVFMGEGDDDDQDTGFDQNPNSDDGMTGEDFLTMGDDTAVRSSLNNEELDSGDEIEEAFNDDLGGDAETPDETSAADLDIDFDDLDDNADDDIETVVERLEIFGTVDSDDIDGTNAEEFIVGLDGNDTISGGLGMDFLVGGDGDDIISGAFDPDLNGEDDNTKDFLFGGDGDDMLYLGDYDEVTGGLGSDTITIADDASNQIIIEDFDVANDQIEVETTAAENLTYIDQVNVGEDTVVTLSNGLEVVFKGMEAVPEDAIEFVIDV